MPSSDPHEDRSGPERPAARGRRGRAVVVGTLLAGLAVVLGVLLLVPRCGAAVQDTGSAVGSPPAAAVSVPGAGAGGR